MTITNCDRAVEEILDDAEDIFVFPVSSSDLLTFFLFCNFSFLFF